MRRLFCVLLALAALVFPVGAADSGYQVTVSGLKDKSGKAVGKFSYQTTFFDNTVTLSDMKASGGTVSVRVEGYPGTGTLLYFAAFDSKGKFLSAAVREISSAEIYTNAVTSAGAARVSAFLTDASGKPLCVPVSVTLS